MSPGSPYPLAKRACLECRLNKTKCKPATAEGAASNVCERCHQNSFQCIYQELRKPGRKAKSHLVGTADSSRRNSIVDAEASTSYSAGGASSSALPISQGHAHAQGHAHGHALPPVPAAYAGADVPSFLGDPHERRRVWTTLIRSSQPNVSTWTFVSAGEVDVNALSRRGAGADAYVPQITTLRRLLRPKSSGAPAPAEAPPPPPLTDVSFSAPRDPRTAGIVSEQDADELYRYFKAHLEPWLAFAPAHAGLDAISRSPFLLSAVLYSAARYHPNRSGTIDAARLGAHTRRLALISFAEAKLSLDVALAYLLLAVWKAPDDDYSEVHMIYVDRVAAFHGSDSTSPCFLSTGDRARERMLLFNYVHQMAFKLHYYRSTPQALLNDRASGQALAWAQAPGREPSDWLLAGDSEGSAFQARYRSLLEDLGNSDSSLWSALTATTFNRFVDEEAAWRDKWMAEGARSDKQGPGAVIRHAMFGILACSIRVQISALAFKNTLRHVLRGHREATALQLLLHSYSVCLEATKALMDGMMQPQLDDSMRLHMPDSISILASHAALLTIYLLLVPAALFEAGHGVDWGHVPELAAGECLRSLKQLARCFESAAALRPAGDQSATTTTAVHLSAVYLADLVGIVESSTAQSIAADALASLGGGGPAGAGAAAGPSTEQNGQQVDDWEDWIQRFLDQSAAMPF